MLDRDHSRNLDWLWWITTYLYIARFRFCCGRNLELTRSPPSKKKITRFTYWLGRANWFVKSLLIYFFKRDRISRNQVFQIIQVWIALKSSSTLFFRSWLPPTVPFFILPTNTVFAPSIPPFFFPLCLCHIFGLKISYFIDHILWFIIVFYSRFRK
jgi:hypothetical protein